MKKFFSLCLMTMAAATMSAAELPFTADPASGSIVSSIDVITFTLNPGEYEVFQVDPYGFHFDKDGEVVCAAVVEEDYNVLRISPETPITEAGTYGLVIDPESLVAWSLTMEMYYNSSSLVLSYTIEEGGTTENNLPFSVSPADGSTVESLETITFTLNEGYDFFDVGPDGFHFDKDGEVFCAAVVEADYNIVTVSPEQPITTPGTYQLVIDEEMLVAWSLTNGMYYNKEDLVFTYIVSDPTSIELNTINTDNAKKGVFNLQGIKVADSAEGLPAGIYIINGKKSVVR